MTGGGGGGGGGGPGTPGADGIGTNFDTVNDNAGAVVIGTPIYGKSNGKADKAKADAAGTSRVTGLVTDVTVATAGDIVGQSAGQLSATTGQWDAVTGQTGGLTPGSVYYLSAATAGMLTTTAPVTVTQFVVEVGVALTATTMLLSIKSPVLL